MNDSWLSLHREEGDDDASTVNLSNTSAIHPPPNEGRLEDNTYLYRFLTDDHRPFTYDAMSMSKHPTARGKDLTLTSAADRSAISSVPTHPLSSKTSNAVAMERIEELSAENTRLRQQLRQQQRELKGLREVLGSDLDTFHTSQVQLREEIVRLRELLRQSQQKESETATRVKELELALMKLEQSSCPPHATPYERLAHLQDAIARAYLARSNLLEEYEAAVKLRQAVEWRQDALKPPADDDDGTIATAADAAAGNGSLSHWRARGKEAELQALIAQKEQLIASLSAAAKEAEDVLTTSETAKTFAETTASKCPGCQKGQWSSPFCPATGHPHAGFTKRGRESSPSKALSVIDNATPPPVPQTVEHAIASGRWRKLVDVDQVTIVFEEVATGRHVADLSAHLDRQHKLAMAAYEDSSKDRIGVLPADAVFISTSAAPPAPGIEREMRLLLETLKQRNQEVHRLKSLLKRMIDSGGLAALPAVQLPDAAPLPAATPPLVELPIGAESAQEHIAKLEVTNQQLNQRCSDLFVECTQKEQLLDDMRKEVNRLRFEGDQFTGEAMQKAEREVERARRELISERRRVVALHEELKRLRELVGST